MTTNEELKKLAEAEAAEMDAHYAADIRHGNALEYAKRVNASPETFHEDEVLLAGAVAALLQDLATATRERDDAKAEILGWQRSFADHVYVKSEEYRALVVRAEKAERERDEALADRDKWRDLEREAAHFCEIPIVMRTKFTGDPPYVGWKGLGLAMTQAFDERDEALAALKHTVKEP